MATNSPLMGFGGQSTWEALAGGVLREDLPETSGVYQTSPYRIEDLLGKFDTVTDEMKASVNAMNDANASLLRGEIPDDVQAQVRQATSESAMGKGLFGQVGRALTARDLGTTSLQVKQQGLQNQASIVSAQDTLGKLVEAHKQFTQSYDLNVAQHMQDIRSNNLKGIELEEERLKFNAQQNLAVSTLMAELVKSQQELAYNYAAKNANSEGMVQTFNNWLDSLTALLQW